MGKLYKDKELAQLEVRRTQQIELFEIIESPTKQDEYSNTIELYDALPKYVWGANRVHQDLDSAVVTKHCTIRGQQITVKITPAIIEVDGRTVLAYPGEREEIIEDALRKLAVNGQGHSIEGKAGVLFTLYELQKELARTKHSHDIAEIKEALAVCRGATLECITDDGETTISSGFFPMVGITTRGKLSNKSGDTRCYVQFNPLVNESILKLSFRQYNYRIGMELRSPLARYIYKRMSHYWTQAAPDEPYTPSLISFLAQSPRKLSRRMPDNVRAMKNALQALIDKKVISDYDADRVTGRNAKLIDIRYTIRPHPHFVKEVKAANARRKQVLEHKTLDPSIIDHDLIDELEM